MKYNEISNNIQHIPLMTAFILGRYWANEGMVEGTGKTRRFRSNTTRNTKMETTATKRNINLSVMANTKALLYP
jgi:hypothetical protein